jgi:hypothetical protein
MQTSTSKIIHKIAPVWQILLYVSILIALFLMVGTSWFVVESLLDGIHAFEIPSIIFLVFGVLLYGSAVFVIISALKIYAVTSPIGLEYHGVGIHIHTPWENTMRIELIGIAARFGIGTEVIKINGSPHILSSTWLGRSIFAYQKGIPLSDFGKWRSSLLRSEMRKYAPKLLAR